MSQAIRRRCTSRRVPVTLVLVRVARTFVVAVVTRLLAPTAVRAATKMALAGKIQDDQVLVVDELSLDAPKTSVVAGMLKGMGLEGKSALIATADHSPVVYKSARNVKGVQVLPVSDLNALAILKPHRVVFTKDAITKIKEGQASA